MSDHMDLLVEQVKMLAGEIAFGTSTLKRLIEQSVNDPESSRTQVISISCQEYGYLVSDCFVTENFLCL